VKAEYLGMLAEYVSWPGVCVGGDRPFVIGVLGASPFEHALDDRYETCRVKCRPVTILYMRTLADLDRCNALFICGSEAERLPAILQALKGRPILTLGDTASFARKGVMVNLYLEGDQVRIEVNHGAAKACGLDLGSHLLRIARVVR
jgi:hypothetical protein